MARFQSSAKRSWWLGFLLSIMIDFCFAYLVSIFFWSAQQALLAAIFILIAFYALLLAYGVISAIKVFAAYLVEKETRVNRVRELLIENEVPSTYGVFIDVEDFLRNVATSENVSPKARFFSAASLGEISGMRQSNRPLMTMTTLMVLEAALQRYEPLGSPHHKA